jgi:hypothetical protein
VGKADDLMDAALPEGVCVSYDPAREGYAWKLSEKGVPQKGVPQNRRTEIAFRSASEARRATRPHTS